MFEVILYPQLYAQSSALVTQSSLLICIIQRLHTQRFSEG